ncbi:unnamed protein product [Diplocarpon coronariae]
MQLSYLQPPLLMRRPGELHISRVILQRSDRINHLYLTLQPQLFSSQSRVRHRQFQSCDVSLFRLQKQWPHDSAKLCDGLECRCSLILQLAGSPTAALRQLSVSETKQKGSPDHHQIPSLTRPAGQHQDVSPNLVSRDCACACVAKHRRRAEALTGASWLSRNPLSDFVSSSSCCAAGWCFRNWHDSDAALGDCPLLRALLAVALAALL